MKAGRLEGIGVVVTRPHAAAEALAAPLAAVGARVWLLPALAIEDLPPSAALGKLLANLAQFDMAIFVSANAEALRNSGLGPVISPAERHDSEAHLGLAPLQVVTGQNIVVFRGEGGREHLKAALAARGACVEYAECYRRVRPDCDPSAVVAALARGEVRAVSVLSAETLENFIAMIGPAAAERLATVTLVVPHVAVGTHREARRFAGVAIAAHGPGGLIDALMQLRVTP